MMRIDGTHLHVDGPIGDGEPLVLVHGGWTDHTTWNAVVAPLARSFQVIRYDRRGHSRSPYGPGPSPRRRDEDDLAELLQALDLGPAHVVGTSYGGTIALALALRRPDLVRTVIAHEPPLLGLVPDRDVEAQLADIQNQITAGEIAGGTRRFFEDVVLGPGSWQTIPEPLRRAAIANAQTFVDLRQDPDWATLEIAELARRARPILITAGDTSPAWLRNTPFIVADQAGIPTRRLNGAGHSPHLTHPDALVRAIIEFAGGRDAA